MPTYTRTLPNLTRATRAKAYEGLSMLLSHLDALNVDLLSVSIDTTTRVVTVVTNADIPTEQLIHFGVL